MSRPMPDANPKRRLTGLDKAAAGFLAPAQADDEIGRLGPYRVLKVLGKGGMGMVFKAEEPSLSRTVALKIMLPELAKRGAAKERFLREAKAAAAIEHEHIISIFQVGEDRNIPFIAMSFLKGMNLDDWLKNKPPLAMPQILRIGRETAKGLQAAHERGLIHRDIKPANLWLDSSAKGRVKILDFGLARPETEDTGLTRSGQIVGTPAYMSPEQAAGEKLDARSDLFSLGVVLYRLVGGQLPFRGPNMMAMLTALATQEPERIESLNPETPPALANLIHRLLEKNRDKRPASAREVVDTLAGIERERILKKLGAEVTSASVTAGRDVETSRTAVSQMASQAFSFEESADSQITDDDFATENKPRGRNEDVAARPPWLLPAALGGIAALVIGIVVTVVMFSRPNQVAEVKPATDPTPIPKPQPPTPKPPITTPITTPITPTPITPTPKPPIVPISGTIDLLPLIDREGKHVLQGQGGWTFRPDRLQSSPFNNKAGIRIPIDDVPAEYRLELDAMSLSDRGDLGIILLAGDRLCAAWLDTDHGKQPHVSALECVDGKPLEDPANPTRTTAAVFRKNQTIPIVATVRAGKIKVEFDGKTIIDWSGDFRSLSRSKYWDWGNNKKLALGFRTSAIVISRLQLTPLAAETSPNPKSPTPAYTNALGMEFALIPKGKSWLGGGPGVPGKREFTLKHDIYLGVYEVTQEEWLRVMGTNPSNHSRTGSQRDAVKDIPDDELKRFPVERVSPLAAQDFVAKVNERLNEPGWVYRLPTLSETEYACRNGPMSDPAESAYHFYFDKPTATLTPDLANFVDSGLRRPRRVGSYPPNRLGLYDLHGNVREWCDDESTNDKGEPTKAYRPGAFDSSALSSRAAGWGYSHSLASTDGTYGLRLARVPRAGPWRSLFNGKDLTAFIGSAHPGTAEVVDDGGQPAIRLVGPKTLETQRLGDFHLRFDYKTGKGMHGGIHHFLTNDPRFELELGDVSETKAIRTIGTGVPFQKAEFRDGQFLPVGEVIESKKPLKMPVAVDAKSPWQRIEIVRRGDSGLYLVNGKIVGAVTNVRDSKTGKAPGKAAIFFWAFGGPAYYRNIEIRDIETLPSEFLGWQPAFNGVDLTGWTTDNPQRWKAAEGKLSTGGVGQDWIWLERPLGDFTLKLQVWSAGNSGIRLKSATGMLSVEIDAGKGGHTGRFDTPDQKSRPAIGDYFRPREWNDFELTRKGSSVTLLINGQLANAATPAQLPDLAKLIGPVRLGLESNGGSTSFRDIQFLETPK